jgi:drug/metabolite transporter (DMT)-like permease
VLFSIILLNYKSSIIEKNHFYGLGAGVIFGILYTLDKSITFDIHPLIYIFWSFMMIAVWGFVLGRKEVIESLKNKKFNNFKPIIFSGVAYFLYNFFTFTAYTFGGEVGRIDAINNSQIFIIILFEFFILRHTKGVFIKIISTILAVVGIFILATI